MTEFLQLAITGLLNGGLYAMVGAAIVLVYKSTHVVSLAHGQFLAFGAFFFYIFMVVLALPFWAAILLTFLAAAAIGLAAERFSLRPLIGQPLFSAFLMTFAIFMTMDGIFQLILKGETRTLPRFLSTETLSMGGLNIPTGGLLSFGVALGMFSLLALFFRYTKVGLGMRATAEDHQLAQSTGISVRTIFSIVWMVSAVVAAVAGISLARVMDIHYPLPWVGLKGLVVALFGGLDSLPGALLAGLILGMLENLSAGYLDPLVGGGVGDVAAYVMLLLILLVKPFGLFGLKRIERI
jgi:branched-chain amino acid transport system permease protein